MNTFQQCTNLFVVLKSRHNLLCLLLIYFKLMTCDVEALFRIKKTKNRSKHQTFPKFNVKPKNDQFRLQLSLYKKVLLIFVEHFEFPVTNNSYSELKFRLRYILTVPREFSVLLAKYQKTVQRDKIIFCINCNSTLVF